MANWYTCFDSCMELLGLMPSYESDLFLVVCLSARSAFKTKGTVYWLTELFCKERLKEENHSVVLQYFFGL